MDAIKQKQIDDIWGSPAPVMNPAVQAGKQRAAELEARAANNRKTERKATRSIGEKILDFTGGKEIAQGLGQGLAAKGTEKALSSAQDRNIGIQGELIKRIKEKKARGEDTSRLQGALDELGSDIETEASLRERTLNPNELTNKQVIGDALQLATTASAGKIAGKATTLAGKVTGGGVGLARGAAQGALAGAGSGVITGAVEGAAQGLQQDKDTKGVLKSAGSGAAVGGIAGGVLGGAIGGVSGKIQANKITKSTLDNHLKTVKTELQNIPEEDIKALGGKEKLFEQNKKDIILQLQDSGLTKEADKVSKVNINKLSDVEEYDKAIRAALKTPTKSENFVKDLVSPKATSAVKEQAIKEGRVTDPKLFKKAEILASKRDEKLAEAVKDVVSSKKTVTENVGALKDKVSEINNGVKSYVKANKTPFNTNQLKSQLDKGKDELNIIFASDKQAEKTYDAVVKEFMKHVQSKDTAGLLDARQEFDKIPAIKKLLESQGLGENVKKQIVLTAREKANEYIAKLLPAGNQYRDQLLSESKMIEVIGNIAEKNAGMIGKNKLQMLTQEYPLLKWIIGGAVGAAGVGVGGAIVSSTD